MFSNLNLKPEEELILLCSSTSIDTETDTRIKKLIQGEINWNIIFSKAHYNGLTPLLYLNLRKYSDQIPINLILLRDYFSTNGRRNLFFLGEMLKVLDVLEENGITAIPYKGPILASYAYGNLALREFGDLDIYINKQDIEIVKKILQEEGYEQILKLDDSKEDYYLKTQRELKFKKNNLILEMQWNVAGFSFSFPDDLFFPLDQENYKHININNQEIKVFSDEDMLLILSVHVAGHLWGRLSWLCDIAELIKNSKKIDWQLVMDKAQSLAISRILYINLSLVNTLFNIKLPETVRNKINEDSDIEILEKKIINMIFNPDSSNIIDKVNLRFKIRENRQYGLKDIIKILTIPQSQEMITFKKNGPMSLLYIFNRPFQIIKRLKE